MVSKTIGYVLSAAAIIGLIVSFDPIAAAFGIKLPITSTILMLVSAGILILGLIVIAKSSSGKVSEVPIYHDEKVVGYRRIKQ